MFMFKGNSKGRNNQDKADGANVAPAFDPERDCSVIVTVMRGDPISKSNISLKSSHPSYRVNKGYKYVCVNCDEDKFDFEAKEKQNDSN